MATTYGAWEYYTGPLLYIDKHGFEYINENNHFVYWYEVEYGPVEYRRKVTDEQGISVYESKFSFGINNASRKSLGLFNFEGDTQLTKIVRHEIVEDGFKQSINKTFYINTNNINPKIIIRTSRKILTIFSNTFLALITILFTPLFSR